MGCEHLYIYACVLNLYNNPAITFITTVFPLIDVAHQIVATPEIQLRGWVHLFMNINEFVKNNCCIKNTEIIFTLYIPSWDIHNIKVKLELCSIPII